MTPHEPLLLSVSLDPNPTIEAYKSDVDRTLLRENLKLTTEERVRKMIAALRFAETVRLGMLATYVVARAQAPGAPRFKFDSEWPRVPLPNKWKLGGITGLAVDKDDNVWVMNRPSDLRDMELQAELTPPIADCCVRAPTMIHIDKARTPDFEGGRGAVGTGQPAKFTPRSGTANGCSASCQYGNH